MIISDIGFIVISLLFYFIGVICGYLQAFQIIKRKVKQLKGEGKK